MAKTYGLYSGILSVPIADYKNNPALDMTEGGDLNEWFNKNKCGRDSKISIFPKGEKFWVPFGMATVSMLFFASA